jgi:hypothetical protein
VLPDPSLLLAATVLLLAAIEWISLEYRTGRAP